MRDFSFSIDDNSNKPKYLQIAEMLLEKIESGELAAETKLPPIRKLAEKFNVNNDTIVRAYKHLELKKAVYSHVGSGTFVSPIAVSEKPTPVIEENVPIFSGEAKFDIKNAINFAGTSPKEDLFPVNDFKNIFNQILERDKGSAFNYAEGQGYIPLRESISKYLLNYGIKAGEDKIQIISGAGQGLEMTSRALLSYSDYVFVERPTFYGAVGTFLSRGAQVIEIPLLSDGIDLETFENYVKLYSPKFVYVMSYFQTPTGVSYSLEKKRKLLSLCEKYDTYIVEEDNVSDLSYTKEKIVPLKALDYKNRVIYIKTFSKIIMPGLRVSFMVLPKKLVNTFLYAKSGDATVSGFTQRAFDLYLRSGLWDKHKKTMVQFYKSKYEKTISLLNVNLKEYITFLPPKGGLSIFVKFRDDIDVNELCNRLIERNIIVSPGNLYFAGDVSYNYIRLSFANVEDELIKTGIEGIKKCVLEMID